jgi:hypothetical protein
MQVLLMWSLSLPVRRKRHWSEMWLVGAAVHCCLDAQLLIFLTIKSKPSQPCGQCESAIIQPAGSGKFEVFCTFDIYFKYR